MSTDPPPRVRALDITSSQERPPRHETVLPEQPAEAIEMLDAALAGGESAAALRQVAARFPAFLDAWARLSQVTWRDGDPVAAYAFARTGYHRGLDALRRSGWGGTGLVHWSRESNRGFLRALHMLLVCAAAVGEMDEANRCRTFLLDLDPDDGIGASAIPDPVESGWAPADLP